MVIGLSREMRDELLEREPRLKHVFKVQLNKVWIVVGWSTATGLLKTKRQLEALFKTSVKVESIADQ